MKRKATPPLPNYVTKLAYVHRIGSIPREVGLQLVTIAPDDWCGIYAVPPQRCHCDPDIAWKASVPGALN